MDAKTILKEMTLEEKAAFCSGRDYWHTKEIERLDVPDVMMCDGPHGLRKQLGEGDHLGINKSIETVCYPSASALASSFDRQVMRKLGEALGEECQAEAVSMLLGPGLNIKRSPLCGRNFEYFSEDPYLAGELGSAYVESLQKKGIAACVKHFACNNQETKRMTGDSVVDERTLHEIYLAAFENVVKKGGTRGVMCAYNAVNGEFCAENKTLLTDILRGQWSYKGFVVTDWGAVKDRAKGISAGLDLEMPGGPHATGEELVKAVKDGSLSETELDRAVLRILEFVLKAAEEKQENVTIDRENCRRISRELSGECAVLLKNENVLPLCRDKRIAFIGEFAQNPRYQGAGSSHINVPHAVSALDCPHLKVGLTLSLFDLQPQAGGEEEAKKLWEEDFAHYLPHLQKDDFIGVQNYTRKLVGKEGALPVPEGAEVTEMGYEFYPEGIGHVIRHVAESLSIPILVTENGIATKDDNKRIEYIRRALNGVKECKDDGISIMGYLHWSLLDNFEWQEGVEKTFGMVAVDRATQERRPKPSLAFLGTCQKMFANSIKD